jgi:hypothetical protein
MGITPFTGPLVTIRSDPLGYAGTGSANQNSQSAPSCFHRGTAFLDPREPYTYVNGCNPVTAKAYGFLEASKLQVLDQVPSRIAANNICATQSVVAATPMTLVTSTGAGITVGVAITQADNGAAVTGLLAIDGATAGVGFGQDGTINMWDPTTTIARNVRITTNGDDTGGTYVVAGYDVWGYPMSETITGVNTAVASGKKAFKYIASVTPAGTLNSTAVLVGTGDVYGLPVRCDRVPYLEVWWGNPQVLEVSSLAGTTAGQQTITIPIPLLAQLANSQIFYALVPYDFTIISAAFYVDVAATTSGKAATLTMQVNGTSVGTGGVIALTSANCTPTGAVIPATTISGTNTTGTGAKSAVTMPIGASALVTWPNHSLPAGTPVSFATTGALPTGVTAGTIYYVITAGLVTNGFEFSATVGGGAVTTSGTQSGVHTATAYQTVGFIASSVTTFVEGNGMVSIVVQNNDLTGGAFLPAVTTTATTTTGDVRGTIAVPAASDGTKRLTVWETVSVANMNTGLNGIFGVQQNLAVNNG